MRSLLLCALVAAAAPATDWAQFRGPFFNGTTDVKDLPSSWGPGENILWTAALPGPSAATPAVLKDRVFVSAADRKTDTLLALCIDAERGEILWQHEIAKGISRTDRSNYASPSPATDGELVVFFYGNGEMWAFDMKGKKLWARNIQKDYGTFAFLWTFATSPLLFEGTLYLQVLQRDVPVSGRGFSDRVNESYLLAMDPKTGATRWRSVRPSKAVAEALEAFSTPVPTTRDGRTELLIVGGDALTGHDPADGRELWRWETYNPRRVGHWRLVPSPVVGDGIVAVCAPKGDPVYGIRAGGATVHGQEAVAWSDRQARKVSSDVPTPAFHEGDFFVLNDLGRALSRVEARTGRVKWTVATPGRDKYEASPLVADGKVYLINFDGEVTVMNAADGATINVIPMHRAGSDPVRSSIVAAHGRLYIRLNTALVCIAKQN